MTKTRKKPISFRAYAFGIKGKKGKHAKPDKTSWWTVFVHETVEDLKKAWMGTIYVPDADENVQGFCHSHGYKQTIDIYGHVVKYPPIRGELGQIHYWKGSLGIQTISHECAHAALYTIMRQTGSINLTLLDNAQFRAVDEHIAHVFDSLCCTVVKGLYAHKLIES